MRTLAILVLASVTACATSGSPSEDGDSTCHEGILRLSGSEPFRSLSLEREYGEPISIDYDATELPSLSGANVRICLRNEPVSSAEDIASLSLLSVDGTPARLGRLETGILRVGNGPTLLRVNGGSDSLAELGRECVWISGEIGPQTIEMQSFGRMPPSICEIAAR